MIRQAIERSTGVPISGSSKAYLASCLLVGVLIAFLSATAVSAVADSVKSPSGLAPQSAGADASVAGSQTQNAGDRFDSAMESLAIKQRVAIVAEGIPLNPYRANVTPVASAGAAEPDRPYAGAPPTSPVDLEAASFDYRATRRGKVFVLRKKYTDPCDLPELSLEELVGFTRRAMDILAQLNPNPVEARYLGPVTKAFVGGLDQDQFALLKAKKLRLADLSEAQQSEAKRLTLYFHLGLRFEDFRDVMVKADECLGKTESLHWDRSRISGTPVLGVRNPVALSGQYPFFPLTNSDFNTKVDADALVSERTASYAHPITLRGTTDLMTLVGDLRDHNKGELIDEIAPEWAHKRVCVYGAELASPEEILRAATEVYGLRLVEPKIGEWKVIGPHMPQAREIADVGPALLSIFPDCYMRALQIEELDRQRQELRSSPVRTSENFFKRMDSINALQSRPGEMRYEAVRRLLFSAVKQQGAGRADIPISSLSSDEKNDIASILITPILLEMRLLTSDYQPAYLQDWSQLDLSGNIFQDAQGRKRYSLFLCVPNPDQPGVMQPTNGVTTEPQKD